MYDVLGFLIFQNPQFGGKIIQIIIIIIINETQNKIFQSRTAYPMFGF